MPRIIEKIIGPLVGVTSEAIAHQQKKSQSSSYGVHSHNANIGDDYGVTENPDYESDAEQWELDSAAEEIHATHNQNQNVPQGNWMSPATIDTIVSNFVQKHPPGDPSSGSYLQLPVVIPQKRPHQKARGFVRAYSPVLEDCGIDQATWMEFLDSFHESIKVCSRAITSTWLMQAGLTSVQCNQCLCPDIGNGCKLCAQCCAASYHCSSHSCKHNCKGDIYSI